MGHDSAENASKYCGPINNTSSNNRLMLHMVDLKRRIFNVKP